MDTLSLMAGDIVELPDDAKIPLHTQSAAPIALASADLAIVGAHGGLAEGIYKGCREKTSGDFRVGRCRFV
ncbi:hypothetical protein V4889_24710 [Ralstonia solanacearum species complex bacterium KE101]|uniref:hypothetical protein n=1 Tax=Ralstonia solanacearum species complex TaxID=3116862 RepID=UPI0014329203